MRRVITIVTVILVILGAAAATALVALRGSGFTARRRPSGLETTLARRARRLLIPPEIGQVSNPVRATPEALAEARGHFADHCAVCHANDGSGDTEIGKNLYPPAPDVRREPTQELADGELFYIIHNGVPLTGMPAWGDGDFARDEESWKLVHFLRHLPEITPQELRQMKELNPKSVHEIEEEGAIRSFLSGESESAPPRHTH
jgi:mono/diheme cytochrome c family protein